MSTAEPTTDVETAIDRFSPYTIGDELTAPNGHAYRVRDVYVGHDGLLMVKLYGQNVNNTMYRPVHRMQRRVREGSWTHFATGGDA